MPLVTATRLKAAALAAFGALMLLAVSGCDLNENADVDRGRTLFVENCGTCHILKEAGTTAPTGPDLDAAFADARASGMDQDTIEGVVANQIEHPRDVDPGDPTYMPADIVTGQDVEDVSAYVAGVAGVPGIEPPQAAGGPGGQVFAANGCGACHTLAAASSNGTQGPDLDEVLPGQTAAMIHESIVDPNAKIEKGYQSGIMPDNYEQTIDPKDLKELIKFLKSEAGSKPAGG